MSLSFRQSEIITLAQRHGAVTVEGLAEHFGVALQTIRRDLTELSDSNKLERVHGGAVLRSGTTNIEYDARRSLNAESKLAMARACAQEIPNACSVFLNIGTSTEAVARQLNGHHDLMIVTNNMNIANIMLENEDIQTIVTGGRLRRSDGALIGHVTNETIRQFRFDVAVIGCSAMDTNGDLLDFDPEEVGVSQTIIAQSRKCFLVADHSKFNRAAPVRIASMQSITAVFTDAPFDTSLAGMCDTWGTRVVVCK